ncbi:ABC transporter ATP-binding protein [Kitasatospora sp. NPDC049258]|uniref:ABC transporter ATP-binding protein n=1 Tax=Kitasatospora sp. NPDC049258 TaxID=3155394 RepID=UPI00341B98E5
MRISPVEAVEADEGVEPVEAIGSDPAAERAAARPGALLSAAGLGKRYGPTTALAGADLWVMPGELVAVMGPSGSGKSTLLHCLAGIIRPDTGTVTYRGQELSDLSDRSLSALRRTDFGFLFQFGQLVPELSCLDNVALPLRLNGLRRRAAEARAREWLERLEVEDAAGQRPGEISGGQGQRVAVARALVTGPRVVFADEPTGALDSLNGERVLQLLRAAVEETGAAVVLVTHEARVAAYTDREVVVRDGRTGAPGAGR